MNFLVNDFVMFISTSIINNHCRVICCMSVILVYLRFELNSDRECCTSYVFAGSR